nr:hypothetical protein [Helicobacter pylori]
MGTFIEKWFSFYQIREELEARISGLENEKTEQGINAFQKAKGLPGACFH